MKSSMSSGNVLPSQQAMISKGKVSSPLSANSLLLLQRISDNNNANTLPNRSSNAKTGNDNETMFATSNLSRSTKLQDIKEEVIINNNRQLKSVNESAKVFRMAPSLAKQNQFFETSHNGNVIDGRTKKGAKVTLSVSDGVNHNNNVTRDLDADTQNFDTAKTTCKLSPIELLSPDVMQALQYFLHDYGNEYMKQFVQVINIS